MVKTLTATETLETVSKSEISETAPKAFSWFLVVDGRRAIAQKISDDHHLTIYSIQLDEGLVMTFFVRCGQQDVADLFIDSIDFVET